MHLQPVGGEGSASELRSPPKGPGQRLGRVLTPLANRAVRALRQGQPDRPFSEFNSTHRRGHLGTRVFVEDSRHEKQGDNPAREGSRGGRKGVLFIGLREGGGRAGKRIHDLSQEQLKLIRKAAQSRGERGRCLSATK